MKNKDLKFKITFPIILFFVLFLFTPSLAKAANYYVDYDNGSDTNDGHTGCPNNNPAICKAWKHAPRDVGLTLRDAGNWRSEGNSKTTALMAGDIVYFKKGVTYRGFLQLADSGSNPKNGTKGGLTTKCEKSGNCTFTDTDGEFTAANLTNNVSYPYGPDLLYIYSDSSAIDTVVSSMGLYEIVATVNDTTLTVKNISASAPKYAYAGGDLKWKIIRPITFTSRSDWGTGEATLTAIMPTNDSCTRPCTGPNAGGTGDTAPDSPQQIIGAEVNYIRFTNLTFKDTKVPPDYNVYSDNVPAPDCTNMSDYAVFRGIAANKYGLIAYKNKFDDVWMVAYTSNPADDVFIDNTITNSYSFTISGGSLMEGNSINHTGLCFQGPLSYSVVRSNVCVDAGSNNCYSHQNGLRVFGGLNNPVIYQWLIGNLWKDNYEILYYTFDGTNPSSGTNHIRIVNNVFMSTLSPYEGWGIYLSTSPYAKIYNNTFFSNTELLHTMAIGGDSAGNVSDHVEFVNNLVYDLTSTDQHGLLETVRVADRVGLLSDYNVFYHALGTLHFVYGGTGSAGYISFADWKTASGQDSNSSISQPLLIKTTGTLYADFDLRLHSSDTVAKDKGTTGLLSYDYNYVTRPQSSAWDIGAYEYIGNGDTNPPAAPTGLSVN